MTNHLPRHPGHPATAPLPALLPRARHLGGHSGGTAPPAGVPGKMPATAEIPRQRLGFLQMLGLSVGRIEVSFNGGEGFQLAGTAWLVADDIAVTSRHVVLDPASGFCAGIGEKPPMSTTIYGDPLLVEIDFGPEKVRVAEIEWVETLGNDLASPDLAFLRLERPVAGACPLTLGTACEGQAIAVIQYPVFADPGGGDEPLAEPGQEHLSAGRVVAFDSGKWSLDHTASTYGGSSGSPVIDWQALQVVGMHSGANPGLTGRAVLASVIAERLAQLGLGQP